MADDSQTALAVVETLEARGSVQLLSGTRGNLSSILSNANNVHISGSTFTMNTYPIDSTPVVPQNIIPPTSVSPPDATNSPDWPRIYANYGGSLISHMGYALWDPSPDASETSRDYQCGGLRIGDVGVIESGGPFRYMFNIRFPSDDIDNRGRVPPGFRPYSPARGSVVAQASVSKMEHADNVSTLSYETILDKGGHFKQKNFEGSSPSTEGTVVVFPDGLEGHRIREHAVESVVKWVQGHAEQWYQDQITRDCTIQNGDIRVVVGHMKACSWGRAVFTHNLQAPENSSNFRLVFKPCLDSNGEKGYIWDKFGSALSANCACGPSGSEAAVLRAHSGRENRNQALFCQVVTLTLNDDEFQKLQTGRDSFKQSTGTDILRRSRTSGDTTSGSAKPGLVKRFGVARFSSWRGVSKHPKCGSDTVGPPSWLNELVENSESDTEVSDGICFDDDRGPCKNTVSSGNEAEDKVRRPGVKYHPSNMVNERLLHQYPNAKRAITWDMDWIRVLKPEDDNVPLSFDALLDRVFASHEVAFEDGTVFLRFSAGPQVTTSATPKERSHAARPSNPVPYQENKPYQAAIKSRRAEADAASALANDIMNWKI